VFIRNGQALGSIQVDPSASDPRKRPAKVVIGRMTEDMDPNGGAVEPEAPVVDEAPPTVEPEPPAAEGDEPVAEVEPETEPAPAEPAKKAPAKKAAPAFKSALHNPKG
jgi:hypothetical protein